MRSLARYLPRGRAARASSLAVVVVAVGTALTATAITSDPAHAATSVERRREAALNPAANALQSVGTKTFPAVFTQTALDTANNQVDLYLKDGTAAAALEAAAGLTPAQIGTVNVKPATYSYGDLQAAITQVFNANIPGMEGIGANPDGSGLTVTMTPGTAQPDLTRFGIPITYDYVKLQTF